MKKYSLFSMIALSVMCSFNVGASEDASASFGETAALSSITRTVVVTSSTNYVDVKKGEIVKFDIDGKSFVWNFDGDSTRSEFDLNAIVPKDLLNHRVRLYIDRVPPSES